MSRNVYWCSQSYRRFGMPLNLVVYSVTNDSGCHATYIGIVTVIDVSGCHETYIGIVTDVSG